MFVFDAKTYENIDKSCRKCYTVNNEKSTAGCAFGQPTVDKFDIREEQTMNWNENRIFPAFEYDGKCLDAVESPSMTRDELVAFSSLQGIVNRNGVRILLLDMMCDQGGDTWPKTVGLSYRRTYYYTVMQKYANEASGVVLYSEEHSRHYINLACTAASTLNAIPITRPCYEALLAHGIELSVLEDLTGLTMTTPAEIYTYQFEHYFSKNTHRIIVSQNPDEVFHLRDLIAAAGCAVLFTENRKEEERAIYRRYLAELTPGESVAIGWYTEERSGITTATEFGLSTVPGDLYCNFTVYAQDKPIVTRKEGDLPPLENKMYVALFVSDGDNIQYIQRFMRKYWEAQEKERGKVAINWTISPALAEVAPDMLNYYYTHSTDKDCFVSGPSGFGYAMPVNTLQEEIEAKNYVNHDEDFAEYVKLSNRYFERSGFRAVTVWDTMTENQRRIYAENAPYLYGLTVQLFTDDRESISSVEKNGMPIKQFTPCYSTTVEHLSRVLMREYRSWDEKSPKFIAAQYSVWGELTPDRAADIETNLKEESGGKVEFLRADSFFKLMRKSHSEA